MKQNNAGITLHNEKFQFNEVMYYHIYSELQEGIRLSIRPGCKIRHNILLAVKISFKEHMWMKLAQYYVQWEVMVLKVLNLWVLIPQC
jgi:hypothetical protein